MYEFSYVYLVLYLFRIFNVCPNLIYKSEFAIRKCYKTKLYVISIDATNKVFKLEQSNPSHMGQPHKSSQQIFQSQDYNINFFFFNTNAYIKIKNPLK